jgi:small acid-soluble spore protein tlp
LFEPLLQLFFKLIQIFRIGLLLQNILLRRDEHGHKQERRPAAIRSEPLRDKTRVIRIRFLIIVCHNVCSPLMMLFAFRLHDNRMSVEKLQDMVQNTIENIEEAKESMEFATDEEKQRIQEKYRNGHPDSVFDNCLS